MKTPMKTPGVYINESDAFGSSIVQVETSVPVFIGYTEKAEYNGESFTNQVVRIESMQQYISYFGGAPQYSLSISNDTATLPEAPYISESITLNGTAYTVFCNPEYPSYYLYNSMRLFYQNGGGSCCILSIGTYAAKTIAKKDFLDGIDLLKSVDGPTIILAPDSLLLPGDDYATISSLMLELCGTRRDRIALFDVYNGFISDAADMDSTIATTRQYFGINSLSYGVSYFPWVCTGIVQNSELIFTNIATASVDDLFSLLENTPEVLALKPDVNTAMDALDTALASGDQTAIHTANIEVVNLNNDLRDASPAYKLLIQTIANVVNILPATPAVAGVYRYVDDTMGVWKAPANVSLNVKKPTLTVTTDMQEGLSFDTVAGKSINAIRTFTGMGVLIWGARTLDGNSSDWRYVSVRRTVIMIEQSIQQALTAYTFKPNVHNTWVEVKVMIESYLNGLWRAGALAGAKPEQAYNVNVGLGKTMTAEDILNGDMRVEVMISLVRPAEFIIISFLQQMKP